MPIFIGSTADDELPFLCMRRVLVTGASGFIGRQALRPLIEQGFEVHAIERSARDNEVREPGCVYHRLDLFEDDARKRLVETVRPTHLLHFAWIATPGLYWDSLENLRWVATTLSLVHEFAQAAGRRVVVSGSCAEYDWSAGHCSEQTTPMAPRRLYGAAKNATREILAAAAGPLGVSIAWGRVFFLYGPGEARKRLISDLVVSFLQGQPGSVRNSHLKRDFLHVSDAGRAFAALTNSEVEGPVNIASGQTISLGKLAECAAGAAGGSGLLTLAQEHTSEPLELTASVQRLRDEVGFQPKIDFDLGMHDTVDWHRKRLGANA